VGSLLACAVPVLAAVWLRERRLDPARRDTDGDGLEDGSEEEIGTDPLQPGQFP